MTHDTYENLLRALLDSTSNDEIRDILKDLGDYADVGLDEVFGPFNLYWHAFGNNPSNISSIGLGTKPGRSLTERLTNAMDAVLEERASSNISQPNSVQAAAKQWFGRPISGPDEGLFNWSYEDHDYDRRIVVILNSSGIETAPTLDVIDSGTGITPSQFSKTILSLQSGNKIQKRYLIGSFGQGGASTLGFCDYALIVSRYKEDPSIIGFTVIRVLNLNETYKEDSFAYLCMKDAKGEFTVPSCHMDTEPLELYKPIKGLRLPALSKGTLVRHFSYKLNNLTHSLSPTPGNLYNYLHYSMFDPLFPFRVIDLRDPAKERDEIVTGSRNRLMKLVRINENRPNVEDKESGSKIKHYRPMEYIVPFGSEDPCLGIEYWVVFSYEKRTNTTVRPHSNDLFIQRGHPIIGTLNGQNQGELTAKLLQDINLGMVARHIVIHIDASRANSKVRRELFSTNREGFKDGPILVDLMRVLEKMLEEDETLYSIERELTERLTKQESQSTSDEVKRQVSRLLMEAGLQIKQEGPSTSRGPNEKGAVPSSRRGKYKLFDPLPTLPFPQVTKFEIVTPRPKMHIRLSDNELVLVETDADAEFDRRGLIFIRTEPNHLEMAAKTPLRGGRIRWRLRPRLDAKVGDAGSIIVTLTGHDGKQLTDKIEFDILPALEERTKKTKGFIPPFEIIPINPDDNPDEWALVWPDLDENCKLEDRISVAYRPIEMAGGIYVYYSTIFGPFKQQVDRLKSENIAILETYQANYAIWIGYHAILQQNNRDSKQEIESDLFERLLEGERSTVARMQVKQALRNSELMQRVMRTQTAEVGQD